MSPAEVEIYDTTLRDGAQAEGVSFTVEEKLAVTGRLDELGIHYIEGGWPGSNPRDAAYFKHLPELTLRRAGVVAFSYTTRPKTDPAEDPTIESLLAAGTDTVTVVGKSSDLHVREVLRTDLDENLRMIQDTVAHLREEGRRVFYDGEQFFDGYKANPDYALRTVQAAAEAGADVVILCDTNGGTMPWEVEEVTRTVGDALDVPLGIHAHDDCGLGVANSLAAVCAGAVQVQGTLNGIGERVGNANLTSIIPDLKVKMGIDCVDDDALGRLTEVSRWLDELIGQRPDDHAPFVGKSAFAHKAGLHADATLKLRESYQHMDPAVVGNRTRVLVSDLSGKGNLLLKAKEFGVSGLDKTGARRVAARIKNLESRGYLYERADASVELLLRREAEGLEPPFRPTRDARVEEGGPGEPCTVRLHLDVQGEATAATGTGLAPADAVERAVRSALEPAHPALEGVERAGIEVEETTDGAGRDVLRALVHLRRGDRRFTAVGCAGTEADALVGALLEGFEYALLAERDREGQAKEQEEEQKKRTDKTGEEMEEGTR